MPKLSGEKFICVFLLVVPLLVVRQWFLPGLPQTHDAETHISRAAVFATSIAEGNVLPRWAGPLNWRYGTPSIMFLYPGIPYLSALIHLATNLQFITIFKLLMISSYVGSGIVWNRWMRLLGFSPISAGISSLFYLLAPYRLVNLFVRGALGEHMGFFFFPLMMLAATQLVLTGKARYSSALALAVAGLVLAHNLSALMYLPLLLIYPLAFLRWRSRQLTTHPLTYLLSIGLGFLLSAFFWIPAIVESKYTLASWMFAAKDWYADNFVFFRQLVWSPWGYGWSEAGPRDGMTFQLGIANILALLVGVSIVAISISKRGFKQSWHKPAFRWSMIGLACAAAGIVLALEVSSVLWKVIPLMPKFQFPWRFLSYTVIGSSLVAAVVADNLKKQTRLVLIMAAAPLLLTASYWRTAGPSQLTEKFLTEDYVGTSDTGETSPVWAIRFQEQFPKAPVEVVSSQGEVEIKDILRLNQRHEFEVTAASNSQLVDNTLYFPGWKVLVDGQQVPIEYQDQNWRGLITFPVPAGTHRVQVVFGETMIRKIADALSVIGVGILMAMTIRPGRVISQGGR